MNGVKWFALLIFFLVITYLSDLFAGFFNGWW